MRNRKRTPADALLHLASLLPWWGGVLLAGATYLILHGVAIAPSGSISGVPTGPQLLAVMGRSLARIGQYILPIIFLGGAMASAWRRRERQMLARQVAESKSTDVLGSMSWQEFERLVGQAYRLRGYSVSENGGGGADGGVDLVLTQGREKTLVQCKQWRALKVGVGVVRELYGVMAASGATAGVVVTSGLFSEDAKTFAKGRNVELVEGPMLVEMIKAAQRVAGPNRSAPRPSGQHASILAKPELRNESSSPVATEVRCPVCQSAMIRRVAKRGTNAGTPFWGCPSYPGCRGTRAMG